MPRDGSADDRLLAKQTARQRDCTCTLLHSPLYTSTDKINLELCLTVNDNLHLLRVRVTESW